MSNLLEIHEWGFRLRNYRGSLLCEVLVNIDEDDVIIYTRNHKAHKVWLAGRDITFYGVGEIKWCDGFDHKPRFEAVP